MEVDRNETKSGTSHRKQQQQIIAGMLCNNADIKNIIHNYLPMGFPYPKRFRAAKNIDRRIEKVVVRTKRLDLFRFFSFLSLHFYDK